MEKKTPHKFPYLSYHLKPSSMMHAITGSFDLGTAVFNEYIQLAEALRDADKIVHADVESMAGLCRLIISQEKEIHFPETYVAAIVKFLPILHKGIQLKLAQGRINMGERKKAIAICELVSSSMRSFYSYVHRVKEKNNRLVMVVERFNDYHL